jgi:hypothetical protein
MMNGITARTVGDYPFVLSPVEAFLRFSAESMFKVQRATLIANSVEQVCSLLKESKTLLT